MGLFSKKQKSSTKEFISVPVFEAYTEDIGHGIAQIKSNVMDELGIASSEIIEIKGKRRTVAKCVPLYSEIGEKEIIRMDGLCRKNSLSNLNDVVIVKKSKPPRIWIFYSKYFQRMKLDILPHVENRLFIHRICKTRVRQEQGQNYRVFGIADEKDGSQDVKN